MKKTLPYRLINFYKDCYIADNRKQVIRNIFGGKIEHLKMFENEELINGNLKLFPITKNYSDKISRTLQVYVREKEMYYGSLFVVVPSAKPFKICAPLLLYKVKTVSEGRFDFLELENTTPILQLDILKEFLSEEALQDLRKKVVFLFSENEISEDIVSFLELELKQHLSNLESNWIRFPVLSKKEQLLEVFSNEKSKKIHLIAASGAFISKKSEQTAGILDELESLGNRALSAPLLELFNQQVEDFERPLDESIRTGFLNESQTNSVQSLMKHRLVKLSGPPGTGKTYTIANAAATYLLNKKSVLIVASNDEALSVIEEKIALQLGSDELSLTAGKQEKLKALKKYLESLLSGRGYRIHQDKYDELRTNVRVIERDWIRKHDRIKKLEEEFQRCLEMERKWGVHFTKESVKPTAGMVYQKKFQNHRENTFRFWEIIQSLRKHYKDQFKFVKKLAALNKESSIRKELAEGRQNFRTFLSAMRATNAKRQQRFFTELNMEKLLQSFSIWLVKLSDLYRVLPYNKEMFDLVILDEATQCDITSALPAIQRGKQLMIAGDAQQLRHFSFLSLAEQQQIAAKHDVLMGTEAMDFRSNSLLDMVDVALKNQSQNVFLNRHYRSHPSIIRFSNEQFYENNLDVMTEHPFAEQVPQLFHATVEGKQSKSGWNKAEVEAIIEEIKFIVEEQKNLRKFCTTIGVVSPFRKQADYIAKKVAKLFTLSQIKKHQIMVGTPYAFQGSERDVMFVSLVVDDLSIRKVKGYLNHKNVFNVAITRAKSKQVIYNSFDHSLLEPTHIVRMYLENLDSLLDKERDETSCSDEFALDVSEELISLGYNCQTHFEIGGLDIDLVVWKGEDYLAIDLIGYPGEFEDAFNLDKYHHYMEIGIAMFPLSYTAWLFYKDLCIQQIQEFFKPTPPPVSYHYDVLPSTDPSEQ